NTNDVSYIPNQTRWDPFKLLSEKADLSQNVNFIYGLHTLAGAGDPSIKN
ncbi:13585_t:CDS:1, partial [Racocetra fulgida]